MRQLTQKLKNGEMKILDVPVPFFDDGQVLVKVHCSLVSAGTEGSTVKAAKKSLIGKAKERPQQVKLVIDVLKTQGAVQTYRAVTKKLDTYSNLGYSCVGQVIKLPKNAEGFKAGDFVACAGLSASHAEIVSVPMNLCVILAPDADLKQAAYNTLGSIAVQGVRQAGMRLGERCAVIGLGLLGQLTCLLLRASGIRVIGVDIDSNMVEMAGKHCVDVALNRNDSGIENRIMEFTDGLGCDGVIITAGSSSLDPINFAGAIARKKGTIVVVGAVPTGFDRDPHFYKKELQVKMSCSYGPGRYDPMYEEKGIDYPPAYVRWTEKRNMQAFQELIHSGKIDVSYLTTHTFKFEDAPKAYDMMMERSEPFVGILIEYDPQITHISQIKQNNKIQISPSTINQKPSAIGIGFVGAGSYAQSHLLPNISKNDGVALKGVLTSTGTSSRSVADRYGFEFCTGNVEDIVGNDDINTVFIATRHDSHADYVLEALRAGKNVFVEKPLCLTIEQLKEIEEFFGIRDYGLGVEEESSKPTIAQSSKLKAERKDVEAEGSKLEAQGESDKTGAQSSKLEAQREIETNQVYQTNEANETNLTNKNVLPTKQIKQIEPTRPIQPILMVGYNRRFSPFAQKIKKVFGDGPMAMTYRINAGAIPADFWIQDPEIGGGRIIGEVCHFIDLLSFFCGSLPKRVYADAMQTSTHLQDTLNINITFENGAIGTISYFANGDKRLPKERVEVYYAGSTAIIEDFKRLNIFANGKKINKKLFGQDKGQKEQMKRFLESVKKNNGSPIPLTDLLYTSMTTFAIHESLRNSLPVEVSSVLQNLQL